MLLVDAYQAHGITYRQLDHWVHRGWIRATGHGQGVDRHIPPGELQVLTHMVRLVHAGFIPRVAAVYARAITEHGGDEPQRIAPHITYHPEQP